MTAAHRSSSCSPADQASTTRDYTRSTGRRISSSDADVCIQVAANSEISKNVFKTPGNLLIFRASCLPGRLPRCTRTAWAIVIAVLLVVVAAVSVGVGLHVSNRNRGNPAVGMSTQFIARHFEPARPCSKRAILSAV